ncbi:hypothetical protein TorRG33x02_137470 [Trema orientale]|uniref:Uncharacterized protein n=1 Tax=Trema orientale TaxID=63057 RepID=A0A2P5EY53_TREOI|nr:hypothetical protein TorRG33x02_137470 [Trema orientale]
MLNTNLENNAWVNGRTPLPTYRKQSPLAVKKAALRDVQNDNRSFISYRPESSCVTGEPVKDAIKVFGTKILTSECPCSPPPRNQSLRSNGSNELEVDAGISLDLELGKRRNRDTAEENADCLNSKRYFQRQPNLPEQKLTKKLDHETSCLPAFAPISVASPIASPGKPLFLACTSVSLIWLHCLPSLASDLVNSEGESDQQMMERFLRLQNVLKQCDESDQRDYIQMLRCLSPHELSRHAVELEKRSMQLSVEEVREIQRMEALDILGTSSSDRFTGFEKSHSKN